MSRTRALAIYLLTSYASVVMMTIQGIVLVPLYLKNISSDLYGAWLASGSVIAYITAFDFGVSSVLSHLIAKAHGSRSSAQVGRIAGTGIVVATIAPSLVVIVCIVLAPYVPIWVGGKSNDVFTLSIAFVLAGVAAAITLFTYSLSGISLAIQRSLGVGIINLCAWGLGIVGILMGFNLELGLLAIPIGYIVRALVFCVGISFHLAWAWSKDVRTRVTFDASQLRMFVSLSGWNLLSKFGAAIINSSDAFVTALLLGPGQATAMSLTSRSKDVVQGFPERISSSAVPGVSHLSGEGSQERVRHVSLMILNTSIAVAAVCAAGITGLNQSFVRLWVGEGFFAGQLVTLLLAVYLVLDITRSSLSYLIYASGELRITNVLFICEALLRLILVYSLTHFFGLVGVPLGATLSILIIGPVTLAIFVRRYQISVSDLQSRWISMLLFPLAAITFGLLCSHFFTADSWVQFIGYGTMLLLILSNVLWLIDSDIREVVTKTVASFAFPHYIAFVSKSVRSLL